VTPYFTIARRFMCVLTAVWSIGESVPVITIPPARNVATICATSLARFASAAVMSVVFAVVTAACSDAYSQAG